MLAFKSSKTLKGFTLVELLVVVGVVLVLGATSANIIINVIRSYNKAVIMGEINENGSYVLTLMESQIRDAKAVAGSGCVGSRCLTLNVTPQEGSAYAFEIKSEGGVGVVKKGGEIITNNDLVTGVDTLFDAAAPQNGSHFDISSTTPPSVRIVLKLRQAPNAPGRVDYQAETTLRTTVVVRGGYE